MMRVMWINRVAHICKVGHGVLLNLTKMDDPRRMIDRYLPGAVAASIMFGTHHDHGTRKIDRKIY